jgi:hypothetical protein
MIADIYRITGLPWARCGAGLARLALGLLVAATAGLGLPAHGATQPQMRIVDLNTYQQQDLRALAMGNAFSAVARGEAALQYNPAGLAQPDLDFKVDASLTLMEEKGNFINDTLAVSSGSPTSQDVLNYLKKYDGTTQTYVLQTFPSAVVDLGSLYVGFGAGNLDVQRYKLQFISTGVLTNDSLVVSADRAQIALASVGFKLFSGKAFLGVTAKNVRYSEKSATLSFGQMISGGKVDLTPAGTDYGTTSAYDAGFIYRLEILPELKPQWSLTAYNVGGYKLSGPDASGVTQTVQVADTYNFGFSIQPDLGFVHILMSAEVEDVGGAVKVQDANGVNQPRAQEQYFHAGIEAGVIQTPTGNNLFSLRAGSNRGYLTYGAELNLWGFLRAVYTNGTDNLGFKGNPTIFRFEAYQLALGVAF